MAILKKTIVLTSLMAYLLVTLAPGPGMVLCFGAGGHMTVEPVSSVFSAEAGQQQIGPAVSDPNVSSSNHCGDCLDIQLAVNGSKHYRIRSRSAKQTTPALLTHNSLVHVDERQAYRPVEYGRQATNPTIDLLKTVVLLT